MLLRPATLKRLQQLAERKLAISILFFLAGLVKGLALEDAATAAVAVGAFNVESADATSGIPAWSAVDARMRGGAARRETSLGLAD